MSTPRMLLTIEQQQQLLAEHDRRLQEGNAFSQRDIACWAATKFNLSRPFGQSTVSRIVKNRGSLKRKLSSAIKSERSPRSSRLDEALSMWVNDCASRSVSISDALIKAKASRLRDLSNEQLTDAERLTLQFSNGWLHRLKLRHGFRKIVYHGEQASVEASGALEFIPKIQEAMNGSSLENIYNADEFSLQYLLAPDHTIVSQQLSGVNKEKVCFTCLACCNASGTDKFPLRIIARAKSPRCFNRKSGSDLGFDYRFNSKAWMTLVLFFEWLQLFESRMCRLQRHVFLLIDNCSAHGSEESILSLLLQYVKVGFLPPNTMSMLQPLDAGIIASLKCRYRRRQIERALDLEDAGHRDLYNIHQLQSMEWISNAWNSLESSLIHNCWLHTKLVMVRVTPSYDHTVLYNADVDSLQEDVNRLVSDVQRRMSVSALLQHPAEEIVFSLSSDEELVDFFVATVIVDTATEDVEDPIVLPSIREQLRIIAQAKLIIEKRGHSVHEVPILSSVQREIRAEIESGENQTKITDFSINKSCL